MRTSALPAIAAALALSSTAVLAQQAQPVPTDTAPSTTPPPTTDTAPPPSDTSTAAPTDTSSSPTATDATTTKTATTTRSRPAKHVTHIASAAPAKVMTRTVTHATAAHVAAPAPAATAAPSAPAAEPSPAATSQSAVQPVVDLNSKPAKPATTASSATPRKHDDTVPIAAGGVLALLAIGSAAVAMNRRRHDDEEEWVEDESIEHEPMEGTAVAHGEPMLQEEQPAIIAPPVSAFGWDNSERSADIPAEEPMVEQDDRKPGETWVERAYRGPSPLNPSVSLKTRLRRAAFFDKRERQAAEGLAAPVDPTAGLPDRMVEERQAELA